MTKKPLITAGFTVAVAAVALTIGSFVVPQGSIASAQSMAKQSYKAVAKLSSGEKQKLMERTSFNAEDQLREAQNAKDLEVLTYAQAASKYKYMIDGPVTAPGGETSDLHGLKFLKYTNSQGAAVLLGLDSQKMPVFSTVSVGTPATGDGLETVHTQQGGKSSGGSSGTSESGQNQNQ